MAKVTPSNVVLFPADSPYAQDPSLVGNAAQDFADITNSNLPIGTPQNPLANTGGLYGGGGGGGGPISKGPLAAAPEWLAYLNELGLQQNQLTADTQRQEGGINAETARQIANLGPQYQLARQGISGSLEARGMTRSGEYLNRLAQSNAQQGTQSGNIQAAGAQQISGLESALAQKLIDMANQKSQQQVSLVGQGYTL